MLRYTKEMLAQAAKASRSYSEMARKLGISAHGGSRDHMKHRAIAFGVDMSHFLGQAWSSGKVFSNRRLSAREILVKQPKGGYRRPRKQLYRALLEVGVPEHCAECGQGVRWRGKPLLLEIHHSNGDKFDHRRKNLRLLCPDCHSQTRTYKNKSRKLLK